jgi:hypothetical protein
MIGFKACAGVMGILAVAAAGPSTPLTVTLMKSAAPMSGEETINRPDCPTDETSSGRFTCRLTDAGRG